MRPLRRLWPHGYFEARLEEECLRASRARGVFAILRVRVSRPDLAQHVEELLAKTFRQSDVIATYGPGEYEILAPDTDEELAARLLDRLRTNLVVSDPAVLIAMACFPADGRHAGALVAKVSGDVRGQPWDATTEPIEVAESTMDQLYRLVERVARSTISIVLQGETGVGKEVMARRIHTLSDRANAPFVTINCAAVSETLLESELFGHERGAFTGALNARIGLLESGHGGTIFLDELGEMPQSLQVKLLRVLEQREVLPVGAVKARPIDVRIIAATNRLLEEEVERGSFRADLFFRLNGICLTIPPLRERTSEIEELAHGFALRAAEQLGLATAPQISGEALQALRAYWWPGNIRELRNVMDRAVLLSSDGVVRAEHLPIEKMGAPMAASPVSGGQAMRQVVSYAPRAAPHTSVPPSNTSPAPSQNGGREAHSSTEGGPLRDVVKEIEKQRIMHALQVCGGNQTRAAKMLGISRGTLAGRLDLYGIRRPRKTGESE